MNSGDGIAELRAAEKAVALLRGLEVQRDIAKSVRVQSVERLQQARSKRTREQAEVAELGRMSMARILATLKGDRETDLQKEQADVQAAEYLVAEAEERLRTADAELTAIESRIIKLGDVPGQLRAAVGLREQALRAGGGEVAERLSVLARTSGEAEARQQQLAEASQAAGIAHDRLRAAAELLGKASSWAAWDTFGGGGLITDSIKYDRMDRAAELMRAADAALVHLARELADVGITSTGGIEVTDLTRTFDVWFDNLFSDWSVRNRISEASSRVQQLIGWIDQLRAQLREKTLQVSVQLDSAEQERAELRSF